MRAYVSLSPSETEFKHGIKEIVAGFENTIGRYNIFEKRYKMFSSYLSSKRIPYLFRINAPALINAPSLINTPSHFLWGKGLQNVIQKGFGTLKFLYIAHFLSKEHYF